MKLTEKEKETILKETRERQEFYTPIKRTSLVQKIQHLAEVKALYTISKIANKYTLQSTTGEVFKSMSISRLIGAFYKTKK